MEDYHERNQSAGLLPVLYIGLLHGSIGNLPTLAGKGYVFNGLTHDSYVVEYQRKEVAYRRRTYRHKAFLSLDYGDDIEREAVLFTPTLQEIVERHLEEERLYQAISSLPEKQRQRVYAHYILGITLMDIAKMEGVSLHAVHESIRRGLRRLEKILEENF